MKKVKALIYLTRGGFYYYQKNTKGKFLESKFGKNTLKNLEVKDLGSLSKQVEKFIQTNNLKPKNTSIILSKKITFKKTLKVESKEAISAFLEEVPFEPDNMIYQTYAQKSGIDIIATNEDLSFALKTSFEQFGWNIASIVPEEIFDETPFDENKAEKTLSDSKFLIQATLLERKVDGEKEIKGSGKKTKKGLFGIFLIVSLVGVAAATYFYLGGKQNTEVEKEVTRQVEQKVEEVEEEINIPREKITITILNGTGVGGLAGELAEALDTVGFGNVTTGNAEATEEIATTISFLEDTPPEYIEEITDFLGEKLEEIVEDEAEDGQIQDIVITTGRLLTQ